MKRIVFLTFLFVISVSSLILAEGEKNTADIRVSLVDGSFMLTSQGGSCLIPAFSVLHGQCGKYVALYKEFLEKTVSTVDKDVNAIEDVCKLKIHIAKTLAGDFTKEFHNLYGIQLVLNSDQSLGVSPETNPATILKNMSKFNEMQSLYSAANDFGIYYEFIVE